jgi:hypothetical protein
MTDEQIIEAAATRAMGWIRWLSEGGNYFWCREPGDAIANVDDWIPLTNWGDVMMLVGSEKLRDWHFQIVRPVPRAITLAALRACGVEEATG